MARYAKAHEQENLDGPGDARPTALQIVEDEGRKGTLTDKVIFLIGATAGMGLETARALAATGAKLFIGARNLKKAEDAGLLKFGNVELIEIDTSSLASVRKAAATLLSKTSQLNILVNNAAIMACPEKKSVDGIELQFATNYLGYFLLFTLLEKTLLASAKPDFHSRVINVSSSGHQSSSVHLDNINLTGEYEAFKSYGQSKTAMIWMTNHIERTYGSQGIHGISVMPGGVITGLQEYLPEGMVDGWKNDPKIMKFMKSPEQGAATAVYAALSKEWEGKGGAYLEDCRPAIPVPEGGEGSVGYSDHAFDPQNEPKLWEVSTKLVAANS